MGERIKLTKRFVDRVRSRPVDREKVHWDAELVRFGLRQKSRRPDGSPGALSYVIQYRNREAISRRLTIGSANAITPDQARRMARSVLARVDDPRERHDPAAEKREARETITFRELVDAYLISDAWLTKAASTRAVESGLIARHLVPLLGKRLAREIARRDAEKTFRDIRDGRTAVDRPSGKLRGRVRVTGGVGTARRTLQLASTIFAFAVEQGIIASNPCFGLKLGSSGTRDTIIEDEGGYAALFRALAELEAERVITKPAANALRLIALTGARRGEILNLRGRHLDLPRQRIVLAAHEHKAGRRTGRPKVIVLPTAAIAILEAIVAGGIEPNEFAIKSARLGAPISLKKPWAKVRECANLPPALTMHGLRHSIGSHLAMDGASGPQIQAALGHATIATSVRYIHFAEARKNALAERAAAVAVAGLQSAQHDDGRTNEITTTPRKSR
jgi:integrase